MKKTTSFLFAFILLYNCINAQTSGTFKDKRDNKTYKTVTISNQTWFAENLAYKPNYGSCCNNNESSNCEKYGRLYTWMVAQNVCPTGWHLPTTDEVLTLFKNVGGQNEVGYTNLIDGGSSGFNALFGGRVLNSFNFGIGSGAYFWTATDHMGDFAYRFAIGDTNCFIGDDSKACSESVRCIKD